MLYRKKTKNTQVLWWCCSFVAADENICVIPTYLFGHLVRACIAKKRVHEACCAKFFQLQQNTVLVAQVVMNYFFAKYQGNSLKEQIKEV